MTLPIWTIMTEPLAVIADPSNGTLSTGALLLRVGAGMVIGACLGSFANATAMRLVRDEPVIQPRSRCRTCNRTLTARELWPLVSWLVTGGACHCGDSRIPARYPAVELGFGLLLAAYAAALTPASAIAFGLASTIMLICALTDLDRLVLYFPLLMALIGGGLLMVSLAETGVIRWPVTLLEAIAGAGIGGALPFAINRLYHAARGRNGFGAGDVWLLAAVGCWLGPSLCLFVFFVAAALGAVAGVLMMIRQQGTRHSRLPFGSLLGLVFMMTPLLAMVTPA